MATVYSKNATKIASVPMSRADQGEVAGRVHVMYDEYQPAAAAVALATVVEFQQLPAGARVLDVIVSFPDQGTTGTFKMGYKANGVEAADDDAFFATGTSFKAADDTFSMQDGANMPGFGIKFSALTTPTITLTEATDASSTTVPWKVMIEYVLD